MFELQIMDINEKVVYSTRDFTLLSLDNTMTNGSFLLKLGKNALNIKNLEFSTKGVLYYINGKRRLKVFTGFYFGLEKFNGFNNILFVSKNTLLEKKERESINFEGNFSSFLDFLGVKYTKYNQSSKTAKYEATNVSVASAIADFALSTGNEWKITENGARMGAKIRENSVNNR